MGAGSWGWGSLLAEQKGTSLPPGLVPWASWRVYGFVAGAFVLNHHLRCLFPLTSVRLQWYVQAVRLRLAPPAGDGERVPLPRLPGQHGGSPLRALPGRLLPPAGRGLLPALPLPPPGYMARGDGVGTAGFKASVWPSALHGAGRALGPCTGSERFRRSKWDQFTPGGVVWGGVRAQHCVAVP